MAVLALLAFSATPAAGQPFEAVGSRALGMAGAFVAVADDPTGSHWNPAGLASGQPAGATIEWSRLHKGNKSDGLSTGPWERSSRFTSLGTWPLGLSYTRVDEVSLAEAGRVERFTTRQYGLTLLQTVTEGLVIGSTLKYVRGSVGTQRVEAVTVGEAFDAGRRLDGRTSGAFDVDVSAMIDMRVVRIGWTARNITVPGFDDGAGTVRRLERRSRAGLAILPVSGLTLALDLDLDTVDSPSGPQRVVAAGVEHRLSPRIIVRAGARRNLEDSRATVGAAGASVALRRGTWLDAHVTLGRASEERGFGFGLRAGW